MGQSPGPVLGPADEENPAEESVWDAAARAFEAWRAGDPRAVDELVRVMTPVLWQVVRAARTSEDEARDVLQSVWLCLVRDPGAVRDPQAVGQWLVVSARRASWRTVKDAQRTTVADPDDLPRDDRVTAPSAELDALARVDDEQLWDLVGRQSPRCQRLLRVAAFLDRPDYRSLATELDLAVGSIGAIRRRCLDSLKRSLVAAGGHHA